MRHLVVLELFLDLVLITSEYIIKPLSVYSKTEYRVNNAAVRDSESIDYKWG